MKWGFFMFIIAIVAVLAVPGLFAWVGWLAFANAKVTGVNVIPAMIFTGMCLAAWTFFLQLIDIVNDYVATKAKANIASVQGDMADGIRSMVRLQKGQADNLASTLRAASMLQNNGPQMPPGGLDFGE